MNQMRIWWMSPRRFLHYEIRAKVYKIESDFLRLILLHRLLIIEIKIKKKNKMKEKNSPKKLALEYFDFFYASTFKEEWNSMRLAMLTGQKHMALVNNFSNLDVTLADLQKQTALNVFEYLRRKNQDEKWLTDEEIQQLRIPPELKVRQIKCFFMFE